MLGTVLVGIGLSFFTMFMWYLLHPVTMTLINTTWDIAVNSFGLDNPYVNGGVNIIVQIEYWWGPLMVIAICVIWLFLVAQERDWRSTSESL